MQASVVIGKATAILQDVGDARYPAADKLGAFNSAQRLVVMIRPDAKTTRGLVTLVTGPRQTLPAGALRLIKVVRNENGRAVSLISEAQLSEFEPDWYTASGTPRHYLFDALEPKGFDVYPPASAGAKVEAVWSVLPTDCATTASNIDLDDIYEMPLVHLTCYALYLRDGQDQRNAALAAMHMQAAVGMLTGKTASDGAINPAASQPDKIRPHVR